MKYKNIIPILMAVLCMGCAPRPYIAEQPLLIISNHSGKKISSVEVKACNEDQSSFSSIAKNLRNGQGIKYVVKKTCIDARAIDFGGKTVAPQSHMIVPPKVYWTIY
jgi:hypothetical protein